ncbi:hypothetical protein [Microvirga makkahensis]|uniref:Uncharacterized protein n=1 Tax=Microvirga makkahensis TaxID=1128670 RepID=A0A7X3MPR6_9HYPH|nr:hypothetical protein [Microvirga makkahensis]MXQ10949.1 hypothetical protein [Microvirga makkahensis]
MRQNSALADAWVRVFLDFPANFAVTLSYNNMYGGTTAPAFRITDDGECLRLPSSGVPVEPGVNRLPTIRKIAPEQVQTDLDTLDYWTSRALFGKRFNRLPAEKRMGCIGFIEHADTNLHCHLLWRVPETRGEEFEELLGMKWRGLIQYGSSDVQRIRDEGWALYVCKDQVGAALDSDEALFVWNRSAGRNPHP